MSREVMGIDSFSDDFCRVKMILCSQVLCFEDEKNVEKVGWNSVREEKR